MQTRSFIPSMLPFCALLVVGCGGSPHRNNSTCDTGTTSCGGFCTNLNVDVNNCGACGQMCPQGESCVSGTCQTTGGCTGTLTPCGNACVDTQTDFNNCGACGRVCPGGQSCTAGQCGGGSQTGGTCYDIVDCQNQCSDSSCVDDCVSQGASNSQALFNSLNSCISTACSSQCQSSQSKCATCTSKAQAVNGACYDALRQCRSNGMTGTGSCGDYLDCSNNCDDAICDNDCYAMSSASAQMAADTVLSCIYDNACATQCGGSNQTACQNCIQSATSRGGACYSQAQACQ